MGLRPEPYRSILAIIGTRRQDDPCVATRTERIISVIKDLLLFLGGLAGIGYQQLTGNVNFWLLMIFVTMTGVPGLTNLISLLRGTVINLPSQLQVSRPSSQESDKSSSS